MRAESTRRKDHVLLTVTVDKDVYAFIEQDRWDMQLNRSRYVTQALRDFIENKLKRGDKK